MLDSLKKIENVYGVGGVGMSFTAWPSLESALRRRTNFTAMFAAHQNASAGFLERGRKLAALHFLRAARPKDQSNFWSAHFDLYSPLAFPTGMWRHLLREKLRRETPDWHRIKHALGYENKVASEFEF